MVFPKVEDYQELLDYVDYTIVLSLSSKTSTARLSCSIPGIPSNLIVWNLS